jgi:hypothetical protein
MRIVNKIMREDWAASSGSRQANADANEAGANVGAGAGAGAGARVEPARSSIASVAQQTPKKKAAVKPEPEPEPAGSIEGREDSRTLHPVGRHSRAKTRLKDGKQFTALAPPPSSSDDDEPPVEPEPEPEILVPAEETERKLGGSRRSMSSTIKEVGTAQNVVTALRHTVEEWMPPKFDRPGPSHFDHVVQKTCENACIAWVHDEAPVLLWAVCWLVLVVLYVAFCVLCVVHEQEAQRIFAEHAPDGAAEMDQDELEGWADELDELIQAGTSQGTKKQIVDDILEARTESELPSVRSEAA